MNSSWVGILLISLSVVFAGSAMAQRTALEVRVPFAFIVDGTTLPAGSYTVTEIKPDLLLFKGASASCYVPVIPEQSPKTTSASELEFAQYGDAHVLSHVSDYGWAWHVSTARSASMLAKNNGASEIAVQGQ